jgi:predicted  nucleic acid-binding Zn-ribbon protein
MPAHHRLLDLQALDLALDRLGRRRRALEAGEDLAAARAEADAAEAAYGELRLQIDALDRDASRLEHEIDSISRKSADEQKRMYDGSIANAKELEAMGREVENLTRRRTEREDELLELMERRETLDAEATAAQTRASELRARVAQVAADAETELEAVVGEFERGSQERAVLVEAIDPVSVELYDDLRPQKKGVAAAALVDGVCQGCHETLSAVELDHVKHAEGVPRCEHCRRILVL